MVILTFWRRSCFHARAMKISLDEWQEYLGVLAVELVRCAHCSDTVWLSNPNCVDLKKSRSSTSTQSEKTVQGFVASPVFLFVGTISDWNMWKELCYFFWDMYPKSGYCHLFPRKKPLLLKFRNVVDLGFYKLWWCLKIILKPGKFVLDSKPYGHHHRCFSKAIRW